MLDKTEFFALAVPLLLLAFLLFAAFIKWLYKPSGAKRSEIMHEHICGSCGHRFGCMRVPEDCRQLCASCRPTVGGAA